MSKKQRFSVLLSITWVLHLVARQLAAGVSVKTATIFVLLVGVLPISVLWSLWWLVIGGQGASTRFSLPSLRARHFVHSSLLRRPTPIERS
jgi:hypothetical protein